MPLAALLITAYLIGSIPFGLIVGKLFFATDLREHGSGNIGATNAYRVLGWQGGIPIFILDLAKGLGPVLTVTAMSPTVLHTHSHALAIIGAGFAAIMGHTASPFLKFKGGKGVATSLGVATGLSCKGGLIAFASWCVVLMVTRYVSVASIIGTAVGAAMIYIFNGYNVYYGAFGIFATVYVLIKHIPNIKRIARGEEPQIDSLPILLRCLTHRNPSTDDSRDSDQHAKEG